MEGELGASITLARSLALADPDSCQLPRYRTRSPWYLTVCHACIGILQGLRSSIILQHETVGSTLVVGQAEEAPSSPIRVCALYYIITSDLGL